MVLDSRRRVGLALENLEVRDLEGMAWHSLQLMIEQQPQGNALASLIREVLGGLPSCSKPAAKSRLQLAQQALDHHGNKLPVSFMPEVVQLMLAYIQAQYNAVHTEELAKLCSLTMEALLPMVVEAMQNPTAAAAAAAPARTRAQLAAGARAGTCKVGSSGTVQAARGLEQGAVGGLASAGGLMSGLLRPVLKLACKGTERNTMSAACIMLEHLLAPFSSFLHVKDIMAAARLCLNALISMLPSMGPLERHVAGVFAPLQQAVELLGISIDPDLQRQAFSACVRGAVAADDWHMRHAAVQALGRMSLAVQVPDPLLASCVEQGLQEYPRSCPQPLVITPAVAQMCRMKAEAAQVLGAARHDRVGCVRQAAIASLEALAGLPESSESAGSKDCDVTPKDQSCRDQHKVSRGQNSPRCGASLAAPLPVAAATPAAFASHLKQQQQHLQRKQQQRLLLQEEQQRGAALEQELQQQEEVREQRQQLLLLQQERLARRQQERQQQAERQQQQVQLQQQQQVAQKRAEQQQRERQQQERAWEMLQAELKQQQLQIAQQRAEQQQQREREQQEQTWELQAARTQQLLKAFHQQSTLLSATALHDDSSEELHREGTPQGGGCARTTAGSFTLALGEDWSGQSQAPALRLGVGALPGTTSTAPQFPATEVRAGASGHPLQAHTGISSHLQQARGAAPQDPIASSACFPFEPMHPAMSASPKDALQGGTDTAADATHASYTITTAGNAPPTSHTTTAAADSFLTSHTITATQPSSEPATTSSDPHPSLPQAARVSGTQVPPPPVASTREDDDHGGIGIQGGALQELTFAYQPDARHAPAPDPPASTFPHPFTAGPRAHSALPSRAAAPLLPPSPAVPVAAPSGSSVKPAPQPSAIHTQALGHPCTRNDGLDLGPDCAHEISARRACSAPRARPSRQAAAGDPGSALVLASIGSPLPSPRSASIISGTRDPSPLSPRAAAQVAELASRPRWNAHRVKHNPQAAQQAWQMELLMGGGGGEGGGGLRAWTAGMGGEHGSNCTAHAVAKHAHLPMRARKAGAGRAAQPRATADPPPASGASVYAARRAELQQQQRERQQHARQQKRELVQRQRHQGHVCAQLKSGCLPQQQAQRQQEVKAVRAYWRGSGGGGGAAAAYAACRERHDYLVADRSRISLHWGHSPRYDHIGPTFQRSHDCAHPEDLDFGIQVFAKPPPMQPVATYTGQPTSISLSPMAEVGESDHEGLKDEVSSESRWGHLGEPASGPGWSPSRPQPGVSATASATTAGGQTLRASGPHQSEHMGSPGHPPSPHQQQHHHYRHEHSGGAGPSPYLPPLHELPFDPPSVPHSHLPSPPHGMQQTDSARAHAASPGGQEVHIHIHPLLTSSPQDSPPHAKHAHHHLHPHQHTGAVLHQQAPPFSTNQLHRPPSPFLADSPTKHSPALHPPPHHHPFPHATHPLSTEAHAATSSATSPNRKPAIGHASASCHPARTIDFRPLIPTAVLQPPIDDPWKQQQQQQHGADAGSKGAPFTSYVHHHQAGMDSQQLQQHAGMGAQQGGSAGARGPRKQWQVAEEQGSSRATTALRDRSLSGLSPTSPLSPVKDPQAASSPPIVTGRLPSHHVVLGEWDGAHDPVPHPIPLGPLPSPLAPHSLQDLRTSVGGLVQSNTDALADLEGMLQRLSRVQLHLQRTRAAHSPLRASAPACSKEGNSRSRLQGPAAAAGAGFGSRAGFGAADRDGSVPGSAAAGAAMLAESAPSMASLRQLRARITSVLGHSNEGGSGLLEGEAHEEQGLLSSCISRRGRYDSPERVDDRVGRRRPTDASPEVQAKLALLTSPIAAPAAAPGSAGAAALGVKSTVPGIPAAPATEAALSARSLVPDQGHSHTSKSPTRSHRYCSPSGTNLGSQTHTSTHASSLHFHSKALSSSSMGTQIRNPPSHPSPHLPAGLRPSHPPPMHQLQRSSSPHSPSPALESMLAKLASPRQPPRHASPEQPPRPAVAELASSRQPAALHTPADERLHGTGCSTQLQQQLGTQQPAAGEHDLGQAPLPRLEGDTADRHQHQQQSGANPAAAGDRDLRPAPLPRLEGAAADHHEQQQQQQQQPGTNSTAAGEHGVRPALMPRLEGAAADHDQQQQQQPPQQQQQWGSHAFQTSSGAMQHLRDQPLGTSAQVPTPGALHPGSEEHTHPALPAALPTAPCSSSQPEHQSPLLSSPAPGQQQLDAGPSSTLHRHQLNGGLPQLDTMCPGTLSGGGQHAEVAGPLGRQQQQQLPYQPPPPRAHYLHDRPAPQHGQALKKQRSGIEAFAARTLAADDDSDTSGGSPPARTSSWQAAKQEHREIQQQRQKQQQQGQGQEGFSSLAAAGVAGAAGVETGVAGAGATPAERAAAAAARARARVAEARCAAAARAALSSKDEDSDTSSKEGSKEQSGRGHQRQQTLVRPPLVRRGVAGGGGGGGAEGAELSVSEAAARAAAAAIKARAAAVARAALDEEEDGSDGEDGSSTAGMAAVDAAVPWGGAGVVRLEAAAEQGQGRAAPALSSAQQGRSPSVQISQLGRGQGRAAPTGADAAPAADVDAADKVAAVKARAAAAARAAMDDEDDSDQDAGGAGGGAAAWPLKEGAERDGSRTPEKPHDSKPKETAAPDTPDAGSWIARMRQRYNI